MSAPWRLYLAALQFVTRGGAMPRGAARFVPLAGIVVGVAGAAVYWLGSQLWPTSVAVLPAMLVTARMSRTAQAGGVGGARLHSVFLVLIKYSALLALSSAKTPFALPEFLTLGLILVAGQAASRALEVSVLAADVPAAVRVTAADLAVALLVGAAPATLLGIPGLVGLAAAIALRLAQTAQPLHARTGGLRRRLDTTQQLAEIGFYLGALGAWRYV